MITNTRFIASISKYRSTLILIAILSSFLVLVKQLTKEEIMVAIQDNRLNKQLQENSALSFDGSIQKSNSVNCKVPPLTKVDDFLNIWKTNGKASCANLGEFGGNNRYDRSIFPYNEAARMVCLDDLERKNCTVISFGVGMDSSFDKEMAEIAGCQVYMFDPTIGVKDTKYTTKLQFFNLGLHNKRGTIKIGKNICKVDTYEGILQMLNLTNSVIDYLKIDIETSELNFFKDVFNTTPHLLDNVRQLAMEIHPILLKRRRNKMLLLEGFEQYWKAMHQLECHGFELISFIPNWFPVCKLDYHGREVSGCYDIVYLNKKIKM